MQDIQALAEQYAHLFHQLPGYFLLKSRDSRYFGFSAAFGPLLKWRTPNDCIGVTDEALPCDAATLCDVFKSEDEDTLKRGETKQLHVTRYCDQQVRIFFTHKRQLCDEQGNVVGLVVYDEDVTQLSAMQQLVIEQNLQLKSYRRQRYSGGKFRLIKNYPGLNLTNREAEVLFYLLRKDSAKVIGQRLCIAARTVEKHSENIMGKLGCYSRQQLIQFAEDRDMMNMLLETLLTQSLTLRWS